MKEVNESEAANTEVEESDKREHLVGKRIG